MRSSVAFLTSALCLTVTTTAFAQDSEEDCPPGGWFCDDEAVDEAEADEETEVVDERPAAPTVIEVPEGADPNSPPVVVYYPRDKPPPIIVDRRGKSKSKSKPPKPKRKKTEWGFNVRLQGALLGDGDEADDAGMYGLGFSLRYRPIPHFALDLGADFLAGVDYNGFDRQESALSLSGIVYFNPKSKFQVYTIGGFGFSRADVEAEVLVTSDLPDGSTSQEIFFEDREYSYFGGHLGLGFEWRVSKKIALNFDLLGFVRGRTDDKAQFDPEFVDPDTGRTTNTSGGGLMRGGVTFYW